MGRLVLNQGDVDMKLWSVVLFFCVVPYMYAAADSLDVSSSTIETKKVETKKYNNDSIRRKSRYSVAYRVSTSSSPEELELESFLDHRLTVTDEETSLYLFMSKSAVSSYNNAVYFLTDGIETYYETGFSRFQIGIGGVLSFGESQKYKHKPWNVNIECMATRYLGDDNNFDLVGLDAKVGVAYDMMLSQDWVIAPHIGVGYEILYSSSIDGESYALESAISGFVYDMGVMVKYLF